MVQLPLALPPLVSGVLLLALVGPYTPVGRLFGGRLTDSLAGIVLAQTFVAAPFLVISARSAFAAADPALAEVGATLGLSSLARFFRISLPVASSAIVAGLLLSWLRAFGEFGATVILAYHPYSLPVFTYVQFSSTGLPDTLAPSFLAVVLAGAVALGVTTATRHRRRRRPAAGPVVPAAPAPRPARPLAFDLERRLGTFHLRVAVPDPAHRLAVLGPSGAGKSTTLRALAGLLERGDDRVDLGGVSVAGLPADRRPDRLRAPGAEPPAASHGLAAAPAEPPSGPGLGGVLGGRVPGWASWWTATRTSSRAGRPTARCPGPGPV